MKCTSTPASRAASVCLITGLALPLAPAAAQEREQPQAQEEETVVTIVGSRIRGIEAQGQSPITTLDRDYLESTGLTSIGDILQELTTSGSALNTRFNSSGNFGYPPDAGGIGAGSAQMDLRHLGAKRVLVLVDGLRWVNESSASGVSTVVDLNTIPLSIIERIEVLEDGASALYGSDAIAGVVNIITRRSFDGAEGNVYFGSYGEGDGETRRADLSFGGRGDRHSFFISAAYTDQEEISSADREQARFPVPGTGITRGSSATLEGRFIFTDPRTGETVNLALNPGTAAPVYDPADPTGAASTYRTFSSVDRFNFSPFNLILTPNERRGLYAQFRYDLGANVQWYLRGLYNPTTERPHYRGSGSPLSLASMARAHSVDRRRDGSRWRCDLSVPRRR